MSLIIPVGPYHPALHEPLCIKLYTEGEYVVDVDIKLGHVHRGIEWLGERRTWIQIPYLAERICGICGDVHRRTYLAAVEALLEVEPPPRAKYIRTIMLELERIHSHLLIIAAMFHAMGFDAWFMQIMAIREKVMDLCELISGNRKHYAMSVIGGVRRDIPDELKPKILRVVQEIKDYTRKVIIPVMESDKTYLARTRDVSKIDYGTAYEYHLVGPTARASGLFTDIRYDEPYEAYPEVDWEVITHTDGDNWARMYVRALETMVSCEIIEQCLQKMPSGDIIHPKAKPWLRVPPRVPEGEAIARSEAPRGEVIHYVLSKGGERPARWRVRTPTYANLAGIKPLLVGTHVADVPISYTSIDPCLSCTNRIEIVDVKTGNVKIVSSTELIQLSRKVTRKILLDGVDPRSR